MSKFLRTTSLFLLLTPCALVLHASEGTEISLPEALRLACTQQPELQALSHLNEAETHALEQAKQGPQSSLSLELENPTGTGDLARADALETTLSYSRSLERRAQREARLGYALANKDVVEAQTRIIERELRRDTAVLFLKTLHAREQELLAREELQNTQEMEAGINRLVEAGQAPGSDRAKAKAQALQAALSLEEATLALNSYKTALAWAMKCEEKADFELSGTLHLPPVLPRLEQTLDADLATANEKAAEVRVAMAEWEQRKAASSPTYELEAGIRHRKENGDLGLVVGVNIPLSTRKRSHAGLNEARERLRAAELRLEQEARMAQTALVQARLRAAGAHKRALMLSEQLLPQTKEAFGQLARAHAQGEASCSEMLQARLEWVQTKKQALDARLDFALTLLEVESLTQPSLPLTTEYCSRP